MGNKKLEIWLEKLLKALPFILISAFILVLVGIIFLCIPNKNTTIKEHKEDYTDCLVFSFDKTNITCAQSIIKEGGPCVCYHYFNITEDLNGDITIYYELDSFDQLRDDYVSSRDDNQLMGKLSQIPSESCEPYRYDDTPEGKIPISPCGAIADAMFNDTYQLTDIANDKVVPFLSSGMLSDADKIGYHNPENVTDLKNFTKPKSWDKYIWELDAGNPNNNGFQNEKFIGWMKTEWEKKPYARVDNNQTNFGRGVQAGAYELRVGYNYPPTRYTGQRKFIISAAVTTFNASFTPIGITSLVIGLLLLATAVIALVLYKRMKENEEPNNRNLDAAHENLTNGR